MELLNNLEKEINNSLSNNLAELQNNFLQSKLGQVVDFAVNQGIRYILPDFVEDEVIEIKDAFINGGFKEAADTAIENAINLGKTAVGIFTGNFTDISQAQNAIKEGGLIDGISEAIDTALKGLTESKIISPKISNLIKSGKNEIVNNVEKNIKNEFTNENKSLEKLEKYIDNWNKYYSEKDINKINKEFKKIEKEEKNIMPIKNIIDNLNKIKSIQNIINNSDNFDFDEMYLQLSDKLTI